MKTSGHKFLCGAIFAIFAAASFALAGGKAFPADAVVDVTAPAYGAIPNDNVDDTVAIQRAITDCVETRKFIYFPAGTYDISDTLVAKNKAGLWRPMLTLQGYSATKTILKLKNNAAGFDDPKHPKAVLQTGSLFEPGDDPQGGGNKAFANFVGDLTIDTGSGNAGAIGIDWAVSNWGAIDNVAIRSGDGTGHAGISMTRKIPGPGLIDRTAIVGFDYGIDVADGQYGVTIEHCWMIGQKQAGVRCRDNLLHVRDLQSTNEVPAVLTEGRQSVLTLLDSKLNGESTARTALRLGGNFFAKGVTFDPAAKAVVGDEERRPRYQFEGSSPQLPQADGEHAYLPVEETPRYWNSDLRDWQAVGARREGEADDTAAIQRAIDGGKKTVYFPIGRTYFLSDTIIVRGNVRHVLGMGAELSLGAAEKPFGDADHPRPLFRIEPVNGDDVTFEHLFFNAQYPGEVLFENDSPKPLIILHSGGWVGSKQYRRSYQNTPRATGQVFIEDVFLPGWNFTRQQVWARQFNPENQEGDGATAQVTNSGGKLWILGFKTEGQAPFIITRDGGTTNLFGAYNYINATAAPTVPADAVPYLTEDATSLLSFTTENFRDNDYRVYLRSTVGGKVSEWARQQMPPRNGSAGDRSFVMPLYDSKIAAPAK